MNELMIFNNPEFGEIRTIEENGKMLFCAKDVALALGYKDTVNAIKQHCRGVVKHHLIDSIGRKQEVSFIPESDVYRLVFGSKLPNAERFTDWVASEVLPTIRKHGAYMTPEKLEEVLLNPDTLIRLATDLKEERSKRLALEADNARQAQIIADFEPMKQYIDVILSSPGTLTTSQIAADYDISAKKLNKILHEEGIQRNVNGQWILYAKYMGKGYTKSETINITRSDGRPDTKMNTRFTQKGRLMIHEVLTKRGILAVMDRPKTA